VCAHWPSLLRVTLACVLLFTAHQGVHAAVSLAVNRVLFVSATGTPAQNCQSLYETLADVSPKASAASPYVVKLEPGLYDCTDLGQTLLIGPWVTVEGFGADQTMILGCPYGASGDPFGVLTMKANSSIRFVGVTCCNFCHSGGPVIGIDGSVVTRATNVRLLHVLIECSGGLGTYGLVKEWAGAEVRDSVKVLLLGNRRLPYRCWIVTLHWNV
jgi:hypothetical protein